MGVFGVVDSKFRFGMGNDLKELDDQDDHLGDDDDQSNLSSSSSSDVSNSSDFMEDVSSSSSNSSSSSSLNQSVDQGPLYEMSSIMSQLPFKRGLSKHYEGKSQSFTSLAEATCLQDLVKPENPYNKRLKSCKSYGGDLGHAHRSYPPVRSGLNKKGSSRGSCGSLMFRRNSSLFFDHTSKPPIATTQTQKINMS